MSNHQDNQDEADRKPVCNDEDNLFEQIDSTLTELFRTYNVLQPQQKCRRLATCAALPAAVSRDEGSESREGGGTVPRTDDPWVNAVKTELDLYTTKRVNRNSGYTPGPFSEQQLRNAATEFVKRCHEIEEGAKDKSPYVLVSQNCQDMPSRDFEIKATNSIGISKLWYALTEANDLLIIKFSSDDTHADGVAELTRLVGNFAIQFDTVENAVFSYGGDGKKVLLSQTKIAPDALLNRNFPEQPTPVDLRAPFIAELEYEHRGPKELMQQLSTYLMQPVADYVLGVKVYKRSGPAVATGKRPFSAVALLWRRGPGGPLPLGRKAVLLEARSFGTCALARQSIRAFCTQLGILQEVEPNQLNHPQIHTRETDVITIPKANLVQGATDELGNPVIALQTDHDFTINLGRLRGIFNMKLPA